MDLQSLTKIVSEKTGLGEDKAKMAVQVVLQQVKAKLPAPAQGYIDQMLNEGDSEPSAGDSVKDAVVSGLGGLLGG